MTKVIKRHRGSAERYARKRIALERGLHGEQHLDLISQEIQNLKKFNHQNVLRFVDAYRLLSEPYSVSLITSPWAHMSLHEFIHNTLNCKFGFPRYSIERLEPWLSIIKGCLSGLDHLHTAKPPIRHKDIKPENILLYIEGTTSTTDPQIRPILADFGISKPFIEGMATMGLGTVAYMAPEQLQKDPKPELVSDIFSLGCCFSFLVAVLCNEIDGISRIKNAAFGSQSITRANCFSANIARVSKVLQRLPEQPNYTCIHVFRNHCRMLTNCMLKTNPGERPTSRDALSMISKLKQELVARMETLQRAASGINLCVRIDDHTTLQTIDLAQKTAPKRVGGKIYSCFKDQLKRRRGPLRHIYTKPRSHLIAFHLTMNRKQVIEVKSDPTALLIELRKQAATPSAQNDEHKSQDSRLLEANVNLSLTWQSVANNFEHGESAPSDEDLLREIRCLSENWNKVFRETHLAGVLWGFCCKAHSDHVLNILNGHYLLVVISLIGITSLELQYSPKSSTSGLRLIALLLFFLNWVAYLKVIMTRGLPVKFNFHGFLVIFLYISVLSLGPDTQARGWKKK